MSAPLLRFLLVFGVLGRVLRPADTSAQSPLPIPDQPSCRQCAIVLGPRRVTLSDTSAATATRLNGFITVLRSGLYLAGTNSGPPQVFDSGGRFIKALGARGKGPREFTASTVTAVGPGDSVAILDFTTRRVQIFDGTLGYARAFTMPQALVQDGFLWLRDGRFLASGLRAVEADIGYTIHLYSPEGIHLKSMAQSTQPVLPSSSSLASFRVLDLLPDGDLISVTVTTTAGAYLIERWDLASGRLRGSWQRKSRWIETTPGPFPSRLLSAWVDSDGLLWTLLLVRAPNWEQVAKAEVIGSGRQTELAYRRPPTNQVADAMMEVIDLAAGRLVAQARFDPVFRRLPNGLLATEAEDEWGIELFPVLLTGLHKN
jgi:hypothetical protein